MTPPHGITNDLKAAIRRRVVALFNDEASGEAPVQRSDHALFDRNSLAWRVHGDVASMMVGGIASLLLQMLHPAVLAGVWDHSNFRRDMHGRLRRTARFIATTTYGERAVAEALMKRVGTIHEQVTGILPDGTPYHANNPALLSWVHITETNSFLNAWMRYSEPFMPLERQDRYYEEMAQIGETLGANPVPRSRGEALTMMEATREQLRSDERTREVARLILGPASPLAIADLPRHLANRAAIDLLPAWARKAHGLSMPMTERPIIRAGTFGIAQTLRWAFS